MDRSEAEEALRSIADARGRLARRARWSWQRHVGFGSIMGALVASYALPPGGAIIGVLACCVAVALVVARDRSRDGFFVNGYRAGRTRWIAILLAALSIIALGAALLGKEHGLTWAPIVSGAALFVVASFLSVAWERAYRAELGDQ